MEEVEDPSMIAICNLEGKRNWKASGNLILSLKTDTNTDKDMNKDTDTDPETNMELETDVETTTEAKMETETNTKTEAKTDTETDAETNAETDTKVLAVYQRNKRGCYLLIYAKRPRRPCSEVFFPECQVESVYIEVE